MANNTLHLMEIPIIFDEICSYLSTKDLVKCRRLNHFWLVSATKKIKSRGPSNYPMITIRNIHQITTHLSFLEKRKFKSIEWLRNYKLDVHIKDPSSVDCMNHSVKLIDDYGLQIVSIILKSNSAFDDYFRKNFPQFQRLVSEVKNVQYDHHGQPHRNDPNYPQYMNFTSNKPHEYFCSALMKLDRTTKLEHLTISLHYITLDFIKDVAVMKGLKVLRMFVQSESKFNHVLSKFIREKCPRLKELYLIRVDPVKVVFPLAEFCDYFPEKDKTFPKSVPNNDKNWLKNTSKLETEFRNIKIVMETR